MVRIDAYGTEDPARWTDEKAYFCKTRLLGRLAARGLADQWLLIAATVHDRIEAAATRPIEAARPGDPALFDPAMAPAAYEHHCARLLRRAGWEARVTAAGPDQGTDILARRAGRVLVVQCKLYGRPVGDAAYTAAARQLARTNRVHLLHHDELQAFDPI